MSKTLSQMSEMVTKMNEELKANFAEALKAEAEVLFAKWPKLENFSWTQYTPYFNDGEPCEFSINSDYHKYTYDGEEFTEYGDVSATTYCEEGRKKSEWNVILSPEGAEKFESVEQVEELECDLNAFISELQPLENTVRACLGEGEVVVSREGVEVEDYDHD